MKKILCLCLALLMAGVGAGCAKENEPAPEPERCAICDYIPSHAPCLVNLNTGEVGEIFCYDPHPFKVGEIAEVQRGGYFCFMSVAGCQGRLDACIPEAHVSVPKDAEKYEEQYFCNECRALLAEFTSDGYVLADLRTPETPVLYSVVIGTEFAVRCYEVSVVEKDEDELDIVVHGTIELGDDPTYQIDTGDE